MKQSISEQEKKFHYCDDCIKSPETCGKDPLECRKEKEAELYFELYDKPISGFNRL